jgi:hypothetical protein
MESAYSNGAQALLSTSPFFWCIQVQLLLQIIINRIRIIVPDRRRSRNIMIATATFVTAINISVFNIWIPARLQISHRYVYLHLHGIYEPRMLELSKDPSCQTSTPPFPVETSSTTVSGGLTQEQISRHQ